MHYSDHIRDDELREGEMADYGTPSLAGTDAGHREPDMVEVRMTPDLFFRFETWVKEGKALLTPGEPFGNEVNGQYKVDDGKSDGNVQSPDLQALKTAVTNWWIDLAHEEADHAVAKAVEYGSTDLIEVGRTLALVMQREGLSDQEHTELGIYFYLIGKIARWTDAVRDGRLPSDDTLADIGIYVRMSQRNRFAGGWPGR
jgi:hypothetical protein